MLKLAAQKLQNIQVVHEHARQLVIIGSTWTLYHQSVVTLNKKVSEFGSASNNK